MATYNYDATRDSLTEAMEDFRQLEQDEPEIAAQLGFAGFALHRTMLQIGDKQIQFLEKIENSRLYWIEDYAEKIKNTLKDDILPAIEDINRG